MVCRDIAAAAVVAAAGTTAAGGHISPSTRDGMSTTSNSIKCSRAAAMTATGLRRKEQRGHADSAMALVQLTGFEVGLRRAL